MEYQDFVSSKLTMPMPVGIDSPIIAEAHLFDHQKALTRWALRRGRAAIFADTGLGKTRMQLSWAATVAQQAKVRILILAPLAVAAQSVEEGAHIGIEVTHCLEDADVRDGINITNYDRLHKFDPRQFGGVVLDESSCIKHHDTKTLAHLLAAFDRTPYKLCATATPAPNDWTELGTHAEFLNVCSRSEMLAEFFVHDGGETQVWRLKGHARNLFWKWVSAWGAMVRKPSDLGFDDSRYILPALQLQEHIVEIDSQTAGMLFAMDAQTLSERRDARRASIDERVRKAAALVNGNKRPWIVWCDLNAEGDALRKAIPDAVEIRGSDDLDDKESRLADFAAGHIRVLISKPSICGWGLNWQHCSDIAFVGVTDSYEAYYQAIRRCWRFGQTKPVNVHIIASHLEGAVLANIKRKERDAIIMSEQLAVETSEAVKSSVFGSERQTNSYLPRNKLHAPAWLTTEAA